MKDGIQVYNKTEPYFENLTKFFKCMEAKNYTHKIKKLEEVHIDDAETSQNDSLYSDTSGLSSNEAGAKQFDSLKGLKTKLNNVYSSKFNNSLLSTWN